MYQYHSNSRAWSWQTSSPQHHIDTSEGLQPPCGWCRAWQGTRGRHRVVGHHHLPTCQPPARACLKLSNCSRAAQVHNVHGRHRDTCSGDQPGSSTPGGLPASCKARLWQLIGPHTGGMHNSTGAWVHQLSIEHPRTPKEPPPHTHINKSCCHVDTPHLPAQQGTSHTPPTTQPSATPCWRDIKAQRYHHHTASADWHPVAQAAMELQLSTAHSMHASHDHHEASACQLHQQHTALLVCLVCQPQPGWAS